MISSSKAIKVIGLIKSIHGNCIQLTRAMHLLMKNQAFINGKWINAADNKVFDVTNPANLKIIGQVPDMSKVDCQQAIDAANDAFYCKEWHNATAKDRSSWLKVDLLHKSI